MDILPADSAIQVYNKVIYRLGRPPDEKQLLKLVAWINENIKGQEIYTDSLLNVYPDAALFKDTASGLMAIALSRN